MRRRSCAENSIKFDRSVADRRRRRPWCRCRRPHVQTWQWPSRRGRSRPRRPSSSSYPPVYPGRGLYHPHRAHVAHAPQSGGCTHDVESIREEAWRTHAHAHMRRSEMSARMQWRVSGLCEPRPAWQLLRGVEPAGHCQRARGGEEGRARAGPSGSSRAAIAREHAE
jgi:hypothetical protein